MLKATSLASVAALALLVPASSVSAADRMLETHNVSHFAGFGRSLGAVRSCVVGEHSRLGYSPPVAIQLPRAAGRVLRRAWGWHELHK